jgi:hypothetical protein
MIKITTSDILRGPGFQTGKMREGYYYSKSNFKNCVIIVSVGGSEHTIRLNQTVVVKGESTFPVKRLDNLFYYILGQTNKALSFLLSSSYD